LSGGAAGFPSIPWEWILPAALGGFIGAQVGSQKLGEVRLRQALSVVLMMAAVKLVLTGVKGL
jgi:hypothetical protein